MSVVRQLHYLQLVDSESDERGERLAEVVDQLGESNDLLRARAAVSKIEADLESLAAALRPLELLLHRTFLFFLFFPKPC